ncbi:MAG TPA: hypothetical protein VMW30_10320 [Candidatus Paceibacterota bacterium]|nr:hypothetical protein [Candidatus Paceibacterota bacterium]
MAFAKRLVHDERGVVESSLVMIPLVLLFLITMELVAAVNFRNIDAAFAQSEASVRAITGLLSPSDEVVILGTSSSSKSLRMVISHRRRPLLGFSGNFPLVSNSDSYSTDAVGIAVMEENP